MPFEPDLTPMMTSSGGGPDPLRMLQAAAIAGGVALVIFLAFSWPWRTPPRQRSALGGVLGVGIGYLVGCWFLDVKFHWPPREDQDRFVLLVIPAVVLAEAIAAFLENWVAWALRLMVSAAIVPVLLRGTIYLTDAAGPGTRVWTPFEALGIVTALTFALFVPWIALVRLDKRQPGRILPLAVAFVCGGAGATIMLSGYFSGGQLGVPLAGALGAVAVASFLVTGPPALAGGLGVALVALFGLLIVGRFFGNLTTPHALILFAAPLLCWLLALPPLGSRKAWIRGVVAAVLLIAPMMLVLSQAKKKFEDESRPPGVAPGTVREATADDYLNFGK